MSVVINVQSVDGADREINYSNKCLRFFYETSTSFTMVFYNNNIRNFDRY